MIMLMVLMFLMLLKTKVVKIEFVRLKTEGDIETFPVVAFYLPQVPTQALIVWVQNLSLG